MVLLHGHHTFLKKWVLWHNAVLPQHEDSLLYQGGLGQSFCLILELLTSALDEPWTSARPCINMLVCGLCPRGNVTAKKSKANKDANTFKASASERLPIYPVIAYFIQQAMVSACVCFQQRKACLEMCIVIGFLQARSTTTITPAHLGKALDCFGKMSTCTVPSFIGLRARLLMRVTWLACQA